jgi:hypothetical protein
MEEIMAKDETAHGNSRRDATHVLAGFNFQLLCSIRAWLDLEADAILALETGEDFQLLQTAGATNVQVKHRADAITLGSRHALEAISNFWKAHENGQPLALEFVYLTTAPVGIEVGRPFGDKAGIMVWRSAITDDAACDSIRSFLVTRADSLPSTLLDVLKNESNEVVRDRLLKRLHWAPYFPSSDDMQAIVLTRIADVIRRPPTDGAVAKALAHLFQVVATVAARPSISERRLTKEKLFEELNAARRETFQIEVDSDVVRKVLEEDEGFKWLTRIDQARGKNFYDLIPFGETPSISIDDVLVAPSYARRVYRGGVINAHQQGEGLPPFFEEATQVLKRDHLFAIIGPFGIGKSVLAKAVQRRFSGELPNRTKCYFFRAYDLLHEHHEWSRSISAQPPGTNVIVVIDGLDELYLASQRAKNLGHLKRNLDAYLENELHYAIVTSRVVTEGGKDDLDYFFMDLSEALPSRGRSPFQAFHVIAPFNRVQIVEWLDKFWATWNEEDVSALELKYSNLDDGHKGVAEAAKTPLFLYMLANAHYQGEPLTSAPNIYSVYRTFLETTIRGKWSAERSTGTEPLKELGFRYVDFLEELAHNIHLLRARELAKVQSSAQQEDWQLDTNARSWLLPPDRTSRLVQLFESYLPPPLGAAHLSDVQKILLSNYFLIHTDDRWGFRDNNLLNYLIARRLGDALTELARAAESDRETILGSLGQIPLERNVLHLVFYWLDSQDDDLRDALADAIYQLVVGKKIVQLDESSLEKFGPDKLYCDVLLALVFLRLNRRCLPDMEYFPKRLDWLTKAGNRLGTCFQDIVRVFFQGTHFVKVEFRRLNYKGYNFTNAEIIESAFIQCRLLNATFRGVKFEKTRFRLCDLESTSLERLRTGSIEFSDCIIDDLRVIADSDCTIDVKFIRCYIRLLHLGGGKVRGRIGDSVIDKLVLNGGHFDRFTISDSISSEINATHANGIVTLEYGARMNPPNVKHTDSQLRVERP